MTIEGERILSHDDCIDRLPWYLAGSLDADERAAVEAHLAACAACRSESERTRAAARLFAAEHPTAERLRDLAWGELEPAIQAASERHVNECVTCREELALARASRALESAEGGGRLVPLRRPVSTPRWARWAVAAAALLAIGVGGFGLWRVDVGRERIAALSDELATARREASRNGEARADLEAASGRVTELERRLAVLESPRGGLAVVELLPADVVRGGGERGGLPQVRKEGPFVALEVALEDPAAAPRWIVRLQGPGGERLAEIPGVQPDARGVLDVLVPTSLLPVGEITLVVEGESARGGRVPKASYAFMVREAEAR